MDWGGREGVIRAATGIYTTQCQCTMGTGRDTERKSDGQERFSGDNNSFHPRCFVRSSFSCPEKIRQERNGEGEAE